MTKIIKGNHNYNKKMLMCLIKVIMYLQGEVL